MEKKIVVGPVCKPSPEELLVMYEKFHTQSQEIRAQFKRGVLSPRHVQALIEHRNPFFPLQPWRTIKLGTGLKTADDFRKALQQSGNKVSSYASDLLEKIKAATEETEVDLYRLTVAELTGLEKGATTAEVFAGAERLGFERCTPEVGPQLRIQYPDQPMNERLFIGMDPITGRDGNPCVFELVRCEGGLWLSDRWANPAYEWDPEGVLVFRLRPSSRAKLATGQAS